MLLGDAGIGKSRLVQGYRERCGRRTGGLLPIVACREAELPPASPSFKAPARLSRAASVLRLEPLEGVEWEGGCLPGHVDQKARRGKAE